MMTFAVMFPSNLYFSSATLELIHEKRLGSQEVDETPFCRFNSNSRARCGLGKRADVYRSRTHLQGCFESGPFALLSRPLPLRTENPYRALQVNGRQRVHRRDSRHYRYRRTRKEAR